MKRIILIMAMAASSAFAEHVFPANPDPEHLAFFGQLGRDSIVVTNAPQQVETDPTVPAWAKEESAPKNLVLINFKSSKDVIYGMTAHEAADAVYNMNNRPVFLYDNVGAGQMFTLREIEVDDNGNDVAVFVSYLTEKINVMRVRVYADYGDPELSLFTFVGNTKKSIAFRSGNLSSSYLLQGDNAGGVKISNLRVDGVTPTTWFYELQGQVDEVEGRIDYTKANHVLVETATDIVREHSGDYWDEELQVWWTGRMSGGKLTYMATTNVNLNAEH